MSRAVLTRRAEEDLVEIWSYIADENPAAADRLLNEIDDACLTLAEAPRSGRGGRKLGVCAGQGKRLSV